MAAKKIKETGASTFEDAMGELESLVEAMENDQLPLEDLVAHYEKGAGLLRHCEQVLSAAKERIKLIEVSNSSEKGLVPNPEADDGAGGPSVAESVEDDIQLL